jgi:hypothetical protein
MTINAKFNIGDKVFVMKHSHNGLTKESDYFIKGPFQIEAIRLTRKGIDYEMFMGGKTTCTRDECELYTSMKQITLALKEIQDKWEKETNNEKH